MSLMPADLTLFHTAPRPLQLWSAIGLAMIVFTVDTFTEIESAIAVIYVLVMIVIADALTRRGIVTVGACCAILATGSYLYSHGVDPSLSTQLRLGVAISAILITTGLLLRDHATRKSLVQANHALVRSERRYRSIFEQARFPLFEQDYSGVAAELGKLRLQGIVDMAAHAAQFPDFHDRMARMIMTADANGATQTMLAAPKRQDVLGPLAPLLPPGEHVLVPVLQALVDGHDHYEGPGRMIAFDGTQRIILIALNFQDDTLGLSRVIGTLVDITQREQTQEALAAARAELARAARVATVGAMSASIAHEINQPLGAIVMNAQTCLRWLRRAPPDLESASHAAQRVVNDGMRASEIVAKTRGILVKGVTQDEPIDLRELTLDVTILLERELKASSTQVRTVFGADAPMILANRVEMQQVLINLITNGMQAMKSTPTSLREILVTIDRDDLEQIRLSVRDHGSGIRDVDMASLFDAFFTTRADGMGMGLAISRSAIDARGGKLTARNHEVGGAVFEFVIPAISQAT
jgi:signal transduction histidine kinase